MICWRMSTSSPSLCRSFSERTESAFASDSTRRRRPSCMNIGQISIIVADLERATAFYRDVLGLPLLFTAPKLAFFDCGGVRLMLGRAETPELDHPSSILILPGPESE